MWVSRIKEDPRLGLQECTGHEQCVLIYSDILYTVERRKREKHNLFSIELRCTLKKSTSRAVPQKRCSHQFPAGLEISRKFIPAWRFEQFEEHLFFDNFLIFIMSSENNYF